MKNAYDWYNVFILFDFVHEVWKMLTLVKNPTCTKYPYDGELVCPK